MRLRAQSTTDPLKLVIVRDMWLTGFDSPPMHTMYVDKTMRSAGLMQAITRVNRTFTATRPTTLGFGPPSHVGTESAQRRL